MTNLVDVESITVCFGDKEYIIQQAGFLRSKPWKKRLLEEVKPLFEQVGGLSNIKFEKHPLIYQCFGVMEQVFVDSFPLLWDLLLDYAPDLEADRAYIEAHATDKQILAAFKGVVKLADPFGVVSLMMRQFGLQMIGT